jgi:hypothetical protein
VSAIDWGDAPTWLGAVFAAGAAAAAAWTLASQRAQLKEQREFIALQAANLALERSALQEAAAERKSEQARQVVLRAVASERDLGAEGGGEAGVFMGPLQWRVEVANPSAAPIRDVSVRFDDQDFRYAYPGRFDRETPAWDELRDDATDTPVPLIGSGASCLFESMPLGPPPAWSQQPVCFFTDSKGVRWRLDGHGDLIDVDVS